MSRTVVQNSQPVKRGPGRLMKLEFDPVADAAYFEISSAQIEATKEIEPGIIADYDGEGHIVGIEVLAVSKPRIPVPADQTA